MAGFVLIHGAFHGGWCFDPVAAILRQRGHAVVAPDLPGMGGTPEELAAVTLAGWGRFTVDLCRAMREEVGDAPVVLAGHSRGGIVIGAAAEADPYAMDSLAYVTALMPAPGQSGFEATRHVEPTPEMRDLMAMRVDGKPVVPPPEVAVRIFAQLAPRELALAGMARLAAEPMGPLAEPMRLSPARWGSLPRLYVECLQDRTLSIESQRAMQAATPGARVWTIDTDHSPFFSTPEELADALEDAIPR